MSASTIVSGLDAPVSAFTAPPPAAVEPHRLPVRFTGSGSEYFRIWIVNLLLTLLTLSAYYPWAKARRLRYFYSQTLVDGQPLGFHGDPRKMFRGFMLVGAVFMLYGIAGNISPYAAVISFAILAAIWPALLKSAQQFRLANTSWRGLRFRFSGTLGGAYKALLPLFVPGLIQLLAIATLPEGEEVPGWFGMLTLAIVVSTALMFPFVWWSIKRYQHDHFVFGSLQTTLKAGPGPIYGVFLKTAAVGLLTLTLLAAVGFATLMGLNLTGTPSPNGSEFGRQLAGLAGALLALLTFQAVVRPYAASRMQNLLWSRTANRSLRFESDLRFRPLMLLTLKNWILILMTLGLYWPFAAIATARLKLESVTVWTRIDPRTLAEQNRPRQGEAAGDAAGDLFGLDIGY